MSYYTKGFQYTIKRLLKNRGTTYSDMAKFLDISEVSVKRLLNSEDISVTKLEKIAQFLGMELNDLFILSFGNFFGNIVSLTESQESFFLENPDYFRIYFDLGQAHSVEDLQNKYSLSEEQIIKKFLRLDRENLIEYRNINHITFPGGRMALWRPSGKLERYVFDKIFKKIHEEDLGEAKSILEYGHDNGTDRTIEVMAQDTIEKSHGPFVNLMSFVSTKSTYRRFLKEYVRLLERYYIRSERERASFPRTELINFTFLSYIAPEFLVESAFPKPKG